MPRVKSVKSLSKACIDFIIKIQDSFCVKMPMSELKDGGLESILGFREICNQSL